MVMMTPVTKYLASLDGIGNSSHCVDPQISKMMAVVMLMLMKMKRRKKMLMLMKFKLNLSAEKLQSCGPPSIENCDQG